MSHPRVKTTTAFWGVAVRGGFSKIDPHVISNHKIAFSYFSLNQFYSESLLNCGFEVLRLGRMSACHVSWE